MRKIILFLVSSLIFVLLISLVIRHFRANQSPSQRGFFSFFNRSTITSNIKLVPGEQIDNHGCHGEGPVIFGTSPMDMEDIGTVQPLGLMTGSHVTPVDHMYFSPLNFHGPRDEYEVRAIADGVITQIEQRTTWIEDTNNGALKPAEFQLRFWHTCDFSSYFDLLTSLSPKIQAEFDAHKKGNNASVQIPVKEGEVVGRIGGQTLDFGVFDYTKILPGFINPQYYLDEPWKVHVVNAFDFFKEPVRSQLLSLDPRTVEPRNGKIDYDVDGKLIGNWFKEGAGGFHLSQGGKESFPWRAFLTFAYDYIDPSKIRISIGDFGGRAEQFDVVGNTPGPAKVDINSGVVKYQVARYTYILPNGRMWDGTGRASSISIRDEKQIEGVVLVQLIANRKLKFEAFPEKTSTEISNFDGNAITYER